MHGVRVKIPSFDGKSFDAYYARAEKPKAPTIVFIQEIFGVNAGMRKMCDDMADTGFHAICPDIFWRIEPNVDITDKTEAEMQKAYALYGAFEVDLGLKDLLGTLAFARSLPENNGKTASLGFCLGGKMAFLMAANSNADCNVSYYGGGVDALLDQVPRIKKPLLMHFAADDKLIPPEKRAKIEAAIKANPQIQHYVYPGVDHAFARINGNSYNDAAAKLANQRSHDFLVKNLGL